MHAASALATVLSEAACARPLWRRPAALAEARVRNPRRVDVGRSLAKRASVCRDRAPPHPITSGWQQSDRGDRLLAVALRQRENLHAVGGHPARMLELRRQRAV